MIERAPISWTVRALRTGAAFALGLSLSAIVLHVIGSAVADKAALLGVLALIATPAISLAATVFESWARERQTALLAVIVLVVLSVATGLALVIGR
jgi:hypothetical protein